MPGTRASVARNAPGPHQSQAKLVASDKHKTSATSFKEITSSNIEAINSGAPQDAVAVASTPPLLALPLELRKSIVEYISKSSDKCSICLVCKELRELVMPYLYRHMAISNDRMSDLSATEHAIFEPTHPGLRHLRSKSSHMAKSALPRIYPAFADSFKQSQKTVCKASSTYLLKASQY